jgi:hypothetical protein
MTARIAEPGFYDLTEAEYHADPCERPSASSGILSLIVAKTLADARWAHPRLNPDFEPEDDSAYDLGSVAHELMLGKGAGIHVIDADDWRKQATKDERNEAVAQGKQPCLVKVYDQAVAMVEAGRRQLLDDPDNHDAFTNGAGEVTAIWQRESPWGPVDCRARIDWRMNSGGRLYDYKTFKPGADPEAFVKYLFREKRALQDPFYSMGESALTGIRLADVAFRYVVQSPDAPYVLSVIQLDDEARDLAWQHAEYALERWAQAVNGGRWEGYRPRTHYVGAPSYERVRWDDRLAANQLADALDARAAS